MDEGQKIPERDSEGYPHNEEKPEDPVVQPTETKQELTNMDVHHHPDLHHKPKPWKEYLLEGLMIFIAVMLGFIAENIRENIDNREHVRELTAQLVRDLKADTAHLNEIYQGETQIRNANDTLINLSKQPLGRENIEHIVRLVRVSHGMWPFHPSAGAIAAIKNELHLKQFSSSEMIGYISEYEGHIALLHTVEDITLQYQRSFIDPFLLRHLTPANLDAAFNYLPLPDPEMRNLSQEDITQLGTDMVLVRINTQELLDDNRKLKAIAEKLLQYVKKQFNLEV